MKAYIVAFVTVMIVIWGSTGVLGWPEAMRWYAIVGLGWVIIWYLIIAMVLKEMARRVFHSEVELKWKPPRSWYLYRSLGFVHLENDGIGMGARSYTLTVLFWVGIVVGVFVRIGIFGRNIANLLTELI